MKEYEAPRAAVVSFANDYVLTADPGSRPFGHGDRPGGPDQGRPNPGPGPNPGPNPGRPPR